MTKLNLILKASFLGILLSALCVKAVGEVLLQEDFESGNLSQWTSVSSAATITEAIALGGNRALHIPYDIPAGEPAHRDSNRFVQVDMAPHNVHDFFVEGCFYIASTPKSVSHRKLFYIWGDPQDAPHWDLVVSVHGGVDTTPLSLTLLSNNWDYSTLRIPVWRIARGKLSYDTWHCIRLEVQLNTPGDLDGSVSLSLDGVREYARNGIALRADNKPLGKVRIGAQIDRSSSETDEKNEDRYWDNVAIGRLAATPDAPKEINVQ